MNDRYGKYLSTEDKEDTVFSSDKSQLHRDTVRDDLETSTQRDVIRQQSYLDTSQNPVYHQDVGSAEPQQSGGYTSYHRQEERRRHEETLDTVRFDGDIDLDKEKKRDQLGFRDYHYGTGEETAAPPTLVVSSAPMHSTAERFSHINDVEQPQKEARYGSVEKEPVETHVFGGAAGAAAIAGSTGVFKTDDRGAFVSSVSRSVADTIKSGLKASEAAAFADKTEPQQSGGYTSYHRQEERRRHEETLDTVRFDGDIDLDKEKKRDQLGFRDYHYGTGEETAAPPTLVVSSAPMHSTAERFSHINDVEQPQKEARYGSVEKEPVETHVFGGAAGAAAIAGSTGVFKTDDRGAFVSSVSRSVADTIKSGLKASEAAAFADKKWGAPEPGGKKGVLKTVASIIGREVEATVGQGDKDGDITDRAKGQATKYGYKSGKYAVKGGFSVGRGAIRFAKYGRKLSNDVAGGALTSSTAKKLLTDRAKQSLTGSAGFVGGIIKTESVKAVEDFHGSDDLGMQAITKPKDLIVGTKRTLKMAQSTGHGIKRTVKTTKSAAEKIKAGGKAVVTVGKKVFANPVVLKAAGIAAVVAVVVAGIIAVVSSVVGVIPSISLKSEDYEVSQSYLYITELDARMEDDIVNEDTRFHIPQIDKYRYYMNGMEVSKNNISVYTNADLILAYLDSRYGDYAFSGIIAGLFGTTVKGELETIHAQLHQVEKIRWTEEIEHKSTSTDPVTGETTTDTWTEYVYHMDIYLTTKTWEDYYETNKDTLLEPDQQQQYEALQKVGVYAFRQELQSPFVDKDWQMSVTSRWGWRIHPISGELKQNLGLDIAMAGGTPINACNSGIIEMGYDVDGWGNYVKVVKSNGDYTLYCHMSSISVSPGQQVKSGDIIGNVGTTGASTDNHLHLEYYKNGKNLNPLIFLGVSASTGAGSTGAGLSDGSFLALISEAEKYIGYPYVWGGSTPSTSFDCSGYICWIFTQSGTYNLPRTTAQGIYNRCTPINQSEAQPGDLIFFTGTYSSSSPVTHIGLYVGNGRMIHCGNPIGYTSINTSYWQLHFYGYGRLK